jgi:hypothetical protein
MLRSYWQIRDEYIHSVIDHTKMYVKGHVHTNGLENFWSLLKRALRGTYVAVDAFHLHRGTWTRKRSGSTSGVIRRATVAGSSRRCARSWASD